MPTIVVTRRLMLPAPPCSSWDDLRSGADRTRGRVSDRRERGRGRACAGPDRRGRLGTVAPVRRQAKVELIGTILDDLYPDPPIPLDHLDPYTLLVAVALSAQ